MLKKICYSLIIIILTTIVISNITVVSAKEINPDSYKNIYESTGTTNVMNLGGKIVGIVKVVGVAVSVIAFLILAIKYMVTSVDEKAQIKQRLIPYLIGIIILFGAVNLINVVYNIAKGIN